MQVDYAKLATRVRELLGDPKLEAKPRPKSSVLARFLHGVYEAEVVRRDLARARVAARGGCEECVDLAKLKTAKVLGSGYFGTVFDVGRGRAIKVEFLESAAAVTKGVPIAVAMGKIGVGPVVHSWRVCECGSTTYLVLEMDKINGVTLADWLDKKRTPAAQAKVRDALRAKVKKMNRAGVTHNDLHGGNVMIDPKGVPWIIDFTFDRGGGAGKNTNDIDWMFSAPDRDLFGAVYDALLADGTVVVREPAGLPLSIGHRS